MWKAIAFGSFLLHWLEESSQDGQITRDEVLELLKEALATFGINVRIKL